ncbi:MAG: TIGR04086 family membrane protein [Clostridia bacterium]|nr:TIGR04086 family membrane protein [Clostridia bacterium]
MNKIGNHYNKSVKLTISLLTGAALGLMISGILLCLCAALCVKLKQVPTEAAKPIVTAVNALGAFASGYIAVKLFRSRGMLTGAAAGLLMISTICLSGSFLGETDSKAAVTRILICTAAAALGGIIRVNKRVTPHMR